MTEQTRWAASNTWFGQDDEMTSFALGLHNKLVKEGVSPQSDDYYEKINSRMRQIFPDNFEDVGEPGTTESDEQMWLHPQRGAQRLKKLGYQQHNLYLLNV